MPISLQSFILPGTTLVQVSAVKAQLGEVGGALRKVEAELHAEGAASDADYLQLLAGFHADATSQLSAAQARPDFWSSQTCLLRPKTRP